MAFHLPTFLTRLGSAVVFAIIMLLALLWTEAAFVALFGVVCWLCLREYAMIVSRILQQSFNRSCVLSYVGFGISVFLLICTLPMQACSNSLQQFMSNYTFYFAGLAIGFLIMFVYFMNNRSAWYLLSGVAYISLSLGMLVQLRYMSLLLPLMLILMIWMNDSLAYLSGSFFGKRPLMPSVSPKKTIEGTLGGIICTVLLAAIWGWCTSWFPLYQWIIMALIASVIGTAGDLVESKLKRMADIKDSGNIMPGHGGALDRFDSIIGTAPFAFLFALIFMKCFGYQVL